MELVHIGFTVRKLFGAMGDSVPTTAARHPCIIVIFGDGSMMIVDHPLLAHNFFDPLVFCIDSAIYRCPRDDSVDHVFLFVVPVVVRNMEGVFDDFECERIMHVLQAFDRVRVLLISLE